MNLKDLYEFTQDLDIDITDLFESEEDDNFDNFVEFEVEGQNVKVSNEYGFVDLNFSDYTLLVESIEQASRDTVGDTIEDTITAELLDQELHTA